MLLVPISNVVLKLRDHSQEFAVVGSNAGIFGLVTADLFVLFPFESCGFSSQLHDLMFEWRHLGEVLASHGDGRRQQASCSNQNEQ